MATTTNYGWTTPDDTALVKDGAAAIRTLGSSVDTTTKALNPSTTLGDIEYRSSTANTNTRLGIGSTGQVLTVAGGVPTWATGSTAALTKISTTAISGSSGSISNCFSATYDNYKIVLSEWTSASTEDASIYLRTGSTNTTSGYDNQMIYFNGNTLSSANITIALFEPYVVTGERIGGSIDIQSPFLTKNTSAQCFQSASNLARLSLSYIANTTSYESLGWAIPSGGSGVITIYGLEK